MRERRRLRLVARGADPPAAGPPASPPKPLSFHAYASGGAAVRPAISALASKLSHALSLKGARVPPKNIFAVENYRRRQDARLSEQLANYDEEMRTWMSNRPYHSTHQPMTRKRMVPLRVQFKHS